MTLDVLAVFRLRDDDEELILCGDVRSGGETKQQKDETVKRLSQLATQQCDEMGFSGEPEGQIRFEPKNNSRGPKYNQKDKMDPCGTC